MKRQATFEGIGELPPEAGNGSGGAREFVERARGRAGNAYAAARDLAEAVDPFVKDRPYATLVLALIAGVIIGGLFLGRGPRVIYVKPRE